MSPLSGGRHYRATTDHIAALCSNNQSRCGIMQQQPITLRHYTATTNHTAALQSNNQSHCGITEQQPITLRHYTATTDHAAAYRATTNHAAAYRATTDHIAALYSNNQSHCGITEQQPITLRHYAATTNRSGVAG